MTKSQIVTTRKELIARLIQRGAFEEAQILLPGLAESFPAESKYHARLNMALGKLVGRSRGKVSGYSRVLFALDSLKLKVALDKVLHDRNDDVSRSRQWLETIRVIYAALARRLAAFVRCY